MFPLLKFRKALKVFFLFLFVGSHAIKFFIWFNSIYNLDFSFDFFKLTIFVSLQNKKIKNSYTPALKKIWARGKFFPFFPWFLCALTLKGELVILRHSVLSCAFHFVQLCFSHLNVHTVTCWSRQFGCVCVVEGVRGAEDLHFAQVPRTDKCSQSADGTLNCSVLDGFEWRDNSALNQVSAYEKNSYFPNSLGNLLGVGS